MHRTTLTAHDWTQLTDAFNCVYEDYVMPFHMNEQQLQAHFTGNDIALDHSLLWLDDDGAIMALAALGVRGDRGWIGGFGVAPSYRGRGLSHRLIAAVREGARTAGLTQVQLEVITGNTAAIRAYERGGFTAQRVLRVFTRAADAPRPALDASPAQPIDPATLLAQISGFNAAPCWQREPRSLRNAADLQALALHHNDRLIGYALYSVTATRLHVADLSADDPHAVGALTAALVERHPKHSLSLLNEPADSALCPALEQAGWIERLQQYEMRCTLD